MVKALSSGGKASGGIGCIIVFAAVFMCVGVAGFLFLTLLPGLRIAAAGSWTTVPCVMVSSAVKEHSSSDGSTYSIEVGYRYRIDSRDYTGDRYSFFGGSSSGRDGKQAVVDRLRPGTSTVCYVDPKDPTASVLERGWLGEAWFGLIPLVFTVIGLVVLITVVRKRRRDLAAADAPIAVDAALPTAWPALTDRAEQAIAAVVPMVASADGIAAADGAGLVLKPKQSRLAGLVFMLIFTTFWNGIVSVFVFGQLIPSWQRGHPDWFLSIFLIPFILVGLGTMGGVVYMALALFNPKAQLRLSRANLHPGDRAEIEWELSGRTTSLTRLRITLEGREVATYRRGTRTSTDTRVFARQILAEAGDGPELANGRAAFTVPADAMPTFDAANNKISWVLIVHGEIPRWPDVKDEYPILVSPLPLSAVRNQ